MLNETKTQRKDARRRAAWESATRAGESVRVEVKVVDWIYAPGQLWMPGLRVALASPMLAVNRVLAVESVKLEQSDDQGTVASLSLTPVEALNPEAGASSGSVESEAGASPDAGDAATPPTPGRRPAGGPDYAPGHWREGFNDRVWTDTKPRAAPQIKGGP